MREGQSWVGPRVTSTAPSSLPCWTVWPETEAVLRGLSSLGLNCESLIQLYLD